MAGTLALVAHDGVGAAMDVRQLAEMRLQTGYVFENGTPFYEKLDEKRADALLKALLAYGYRTASPPKTIPLTDCFSEKIVPSTSGALIATRQIVQRFAIRGTESQVGPPRASPQVAEANTETELAMALRAAFHVVRHEGR
jgi:hypothetical protein